MLNSTCCLRHLQAYNVDRVLLARVQTYSYTAAMTSCRSDNLVLVSNTGHRSRCRRLVHFGWDACLLVERTEDESFACCGVVWLDGRLLFAFMCKAHRRRRPVVTLHCCVVTLTCVATDATEEDNGAGTYGVLWPVGNCFTNSTGSFAKVTRTVSLLSSVQN